MKKLFYLATATALFASFGSCSKSVEAKLSTDTDTLSYSIGVMNCDPRMKMFLNSQLELDSTNYKAFVDGFISGARATDKNEIARAIGFQMGLQAASQKGIKQMSEYLFQGDSTKMLNQEALIAGYVATFMEDKNAPIDTESARAYMEAFQKKQYEDNMAKQYADWKKQNEDFLASNAKKGGVVTTESGLQYLITKKGEGAIANDTTKLKVTYTGKLIDGTKFDSSYKEDSKTKGVTNHPLTCTPSGNIIEGWKEILRTVPVGTVCTIYVPAKLGYGAQNMGTIKPFSTLIFDIEIAE